VPEPQPSGPEKLIVPHAAPQGGTRVERQGLYNSGILMPGQSSTFTFPTPGVYSYVCVIHAQQGMFGKVIVEAAGAATGPVSLPDTGGEPWGGLLPLLLAVAGVSMLGLGLLVRTARPRRQP
jgi:hypothetical protein